MSTTQTFTVTIELGNDAMQEAAHAADALRDVAAALYAGQTDGPVRDENGNTVGRYHMTHPEETTY